MKIGTLVNKFSCFLISLHFVVVVAFVLAGLLLLLEVVVVEVVVIVVVELVVEVVIVVVETVDRCDKHKRYDNRSDTSLITCH